MYSGPRSLVGVGLACLVYLGPGVSATQAQQVRIESVFPRQAPRGQTTIINVAVPSRDAIQAAEISPPAGVTVSGITRGPTFQGALTWSELTIAVAADAAPGDRTLVLQLPMGRTAPTTFTIPGHVPAISELRVLPPPSGLATIEVQFAATDPSADLGDGPYVWFSIACGGESLPGVVRGTVKARDTNSGVVRAGIPNPRAPARAGAPTAGPCDLQLRMADSGGIESNTLKTAVDVVPPPAAQAPSPQAPASGAAADAGGGEWVEVASQEERFMTVFPAQPAITETMWPSQFGAVLPARVYSVTERQSRYSLTVVDYNPIERLLVERSRACPPGANTCQGIADWGIGYWKTDVRGALLYALSKFLARDARATSLIWNGIALVQGLELRLTNNADQSRTFASIYMHENRLVVVEATVPRGDPPPVAFNESLNWLDERGRTVRYTSTYVNMPDVPKPGVRGGAAPNPPGGAEGGPGGQGR